MKLVDAYMAWCPNFHIHADLARVGQIVVGTQEVALRESDHTRMGGDVLPSWRGVCAGSGMVLGGSTPMGRLVLMFAAFNRLVVRDRLAPDVVHEAFLAIDEYRAAVAPGTF